MHEYTAACPGEPGSQLAQAMLELRGWAVWFLNDLSGGTARAIQVGETLLADMERILGPDHPGTLTSRNNLAAARASQG